MRAWFSHQQPGRTGGAGKAGRIGGHGGRALGLALLAVAGLAWSGCDANSQGSAQLAEAGKQLAAAATKLDAISTKLDLVTTRLALIETRLASAGTAVAAARATAPTPTPAAAPTLPTPTAAAQPPKPAAPQPPPPTGQTPTIAAEKDTHDFGTIWAGPRLAHTFTVRNTGSSPLTITRVQPDCGCTAAGAHPRSIAPGGTGQFPFTLDSTRVNGPFTKAVRIFSNDPSNAEFKLYLKGHSKHQVAISPERAYFGTLTNNSTPEKKILKMTNNTETPLELALETPPPDSKYAFELKELQPGQAYELHVTTKPPFTTGYVTGKATLTTNIPDRKSIDVTALARVPERIDIQPTSITIVPPATGSGTPQAASRYVRISNFGEEPVKVLSATATDPSVTATITEQTPGKAYTVTVQLPAGYTPPATGHSLTLKTDDAEKPTIQIPIRSLNRQVAARPPARPATPRARPEDLVGKETPEFALQTYDGKPISNDTIGEAPATVLNFVAPNCGFCKRQVPVVESVRSEYEAKGVRFVNVGQTMRQPYPDDQIKKIFIDDLGSKLELTNDPGNKVGALFNVRGFPTMVVVGKDGVIKSVNVGAKADLKNILSKQLDEIIP